MNHIESIKQNINVIKFILHLYGLKIEYLKIGFISVT
jgi:hypothetical protein